MMRNEKPTIYEELIKALEAYYDVGEALQDDDGKAGGATKGTGNAGGDGGGLSVTKQV